MVLINNYAQNSIEQPFPLNWRLLTCTVTHLTWRGGARERSAAQVLGKNALAMAFVWKKKISRHASTSSTSFPAPTAAQEVEAHLIPFPLNIRSMLNLTLAVHHFDEGWDNMRVKMRTRLFADIFHRLRTRPGRPIGAI
jgi:hypothetical protein